ncbi:carbohydrate kinase family protein [Paracoccaceae bacterium GXU_MW_L88]
MYLICGEALFDFFFGPGDDPAKCDVNGRAGGSPFNVAIGISRLEGKSALFTGLSTDLLGQRLAAVLAGEGVSTSYLHRTEKQTTLSLVGLDAAGHPAYAFYGKGTADTSLTEFDLPALGDDVVGIHMGSYSLAVSPTADSLAKLAARESHRFLSLDPNIRPTIEPSMEVWKQRLDTLKPHADLVKVSAEDLDMLGFTADEFAKSYLDANAALVVVTDGGGAARGWHRSGMTSHATPPAITVVDTVGAGDTFMAALLAELGDSPREKLDAMDQYGLDALLGFASRAAAVTCTRQGADLPTRADIG